jgi:hypothetical protein
MKKWVVFDYVELYKAGYHEERCDLFERIDDLTRLAF